MKIGPEILAPVGGPEQLIAAVRCGADAVYFGLRGFNARRNAENFDDDTLAERIYYCHERDVKVYITINTLIKDSEEELMRDTVDTACSAGADGLIVQDLAVASYCLKRHPDTLIFASTQMAVHNAEGVRLLKDYGFSRFVLARELSLDEIRDIYDKTGEELEVFVHGAHCMSVSGNCYMSSIIGGRSGNRGLCAQPCRLECTVNGRDHALSLKDLSYVRHIRALAEAGVYSVKIEGRMKRAEYVAAAVTACRQARDGEDADIDTLRAVFSRSGFTDGYLTGRRTLDMFGYRTKDDVTAAAGVLKRLSALYAKEPQNIPVDMVLVLRGGAESELTVSDGIYTVSVAGVVPQAAETITMDEETARKSLGKTGGTPYRLKKLEVISDRPLMLTLGQLNELRRSALSALAKKRIGRRE